MTGLELTARVAARGVDVTLSAPAGTTTALLGRNGAGKSTVLAVAAGLLVPDEGTVDLDDRRLTTCGSGGKSQVVPPHRRGIGLLQQDALLFPHLSVLDNVAFGRRSRGDSSVGARAEARRWLEEVGDADLADRRPRELSGGQAQRVAVARALAAAPDLLLLDEPLAAIDVAARPRLRQVLRRVLAGRTTVLVTHDPLDALLLSEQAIVLEDGSVVETGATSVVLTRPRSRFAALLAGLNLVRGTWQDGAVTSPDGLRIHGTATDGLPGEGTPVGATFRPNAVSVYRERVAGSPRNALDVVIDDLEPRADQIRVHAGSIAADITVQAAAELDLHEGQRVWFSVKALDVAVHEAG